MKFYRNRRGIFANETGKFISKKNLNAIIKRSAKDTSLTDYKSLKQLVYSSIKYIETDKKGRIAYMSSKAKPTKRNVKRSYRHHVNKRPSYKKLYKNTVKRLHKVTAQMQKLENQYSVGKFHPFIVNKTKHAEVTPETNYKDVINWSHDHGGKLFVVAALGNDDQSIVKACGSVHKNEAAGFGATELLPQLNEIFSSGFND